MPGSAIKTIVIPRWSRASGGMRGTHEHWSSKVFMGGPNKSGHDENGLRRRSG
jgi:hypothetical protein